MTRWHHLCRSHGSGAARRADPRMKSSRVRSGGSRTSDILQVDVAGPARRAAGLQCPLLPALLLLLQLRILGNGVWAGRLLPHPLRYLAQAQQST